MERSVREAVDGLEQEVGGQRAFAVGQVRDVPGDRANGCLVDLFGNDGGEAGVAGKGYSADWEGRVLDGS